MKLYTNPASPFGRKVKVLVEELNASHQVETVHVAGSPLDAGTIPISDNPLGKLPILTDIKLGALYDSRVICDYLNALFKGGLYPKGDNRFAVLRLEALADGIMDASVLIVYERRCRPETGQSDDWMAGQWQKVRRSLAFLESRVEGWSDTDLCIGQIGVGCALGYLDFRHSDRPWRGECPKLADWFETFGSRSSMIQTRPE